MNISNFKYFNERIKMEKSKFSFFIVKFVETAYRNLDL